MKKSQGHAANTAALRRHAEDRLKLQKSKRGGRKANAQTAAHVHELEMQNKKLRQARANLEALLARYIALYDFAPIGCMTLDRKGVVRQVNLAGARLLGVARSRLANRRFGPFVAKGERSAFSGFLQKVFASRTKVCCEVLLLQRRRGALSVQIQGACSKDGRECRVVMVDVTGHKRVEEALNSSEVRYRRLFESAKDGILILNAETGAIMDANPFLIKVLGFSRAQLFGRKIWELGFFKDVLANRAKFLELQKKEYVRYEDLPLETASGKQFEAEFVSNVYEVDRHRVIQCNIRDITERRRVERRRNRRSKEQVKAYQAKLRSLASQLSLAEERERRRIAIALHDDVGQGLALIKIKLGGMLRAGRGDDLTESLKTIQRMIVQMINHTRFLTFELSPPILYELGFEAAVSWLVEEFQKRHGIHCEYEDDRQPKPLEDDTCVNLFQSVRELLFNVVKHARAKNVKVRVEGVGAEIRIRVEDDGIGFAADDFWSNHKKPGLGLFSIRERLRNIGGDMQVESQLGRGAQVTLVAPLALSNHA